MAWAACGTGFGERAEEQTTEPESQTPSTAQTEFSPSNVVKELIDTSRGEGGLKLAKSTGHKMEIEGSGSAAD